MAPDTYLTPPERTPWFPKLALTLFAWMAFFNIVFTVVQLLPRIFHPKPGFLIPLYWLCQALVVVFAIWATIVWHANEKRRRIDSPRWYALGQGILRYWLAFELCIYGFAKIMGTQFSHVFSRDDIPVGRLSGFELTWSYFGYSYVFAVFIALVQIGGSILLLFRRTTLLGAILLLPVMINILLINIFYHIPVVLNASLFTLGLIVLLYLRRKELIEVFLRHVPQLPKMGKGWMRWTFRLLVIGGAFGIVYSFSENTRHSPLEGKWHIDTLKRNSHLYKEDEWLTNSGAWTTAYLERQGKFILCPNPYLYDASRSYAGIYQYDVPGRRLQVIFYNGKGAGIDTLVATVDHYDGSHMEWKGMIGKDTLSVELSRARN